MIYISAPYRASLVPNRNRVIRRVILTFNEPVVDEALPVCNWNVPTPLVRGKVFVPSWPHKDSKNSTNALSDECSIHNF